METIGTSKMHQGPMEWVWKRPDDLKITNIISCRNKKNRRRVIKMCLDERGSRERMQDAIQIQYGPQECQNSEHKKLLKKNNKLANLARSINKHQKTYKNRHDQFQQRSLNRSWCSLNWKCGTERVITHFPRRHPRHRKRPILHNNELISS